MKKTILLSSILAVGAAFASATVDSTEIGVMGIDMPTGSGLIAVPFLGYDTANIVVADMVNTAELAPGSKLYVPNTSGNYDVWTLNDSKVWKQTETVTIGTSVSAGAGVEANKVTTARGGAFWLEPAADSATTVYLLGKPASDSGSSTAVGGKWNLIGNTSERAVDLKTLVVRNRDQVAVQVDGKFRYYMYMGDTNGWCYQREDNGEWQKKVDVLVALGQGIWFKPTTNTTIDWSTYNVVAQ